MGEMYETLGVYATNATEYASYTADYTHFPGLRDVVDMFDAAALKDFPVLDCGCGGGRDARRLASRGRTVIALDAVYELLATARIDVLAGSVLLVQADMRHPPLAASSLGGVLLCSSLIHLPRTDVVPVLIALRRLIRSGGLLAATVRTSGPRGWLVSPPISQPRWQSELTPERLVRSLEATGFRSISSTPSGPGWRLVTGTP